MFDFNDLNTNAGGGGLQGPFIGWQSKVTANAPAENWTLRGKTDDNQPTFSLITEQFRAGVIFDYNTLKLGWERHAPMGTMGTTNWAPGLNLEAFPRPDDTKRMNDMGREVFNWQKTFAIRIAVQPELAGTWNQSAFGAMLGFERFVDQLKAAGPQHPGKLPLVQFTGVEEDFGGAKVPVLTIVDWKDAPDCLKQKIAAATQINTGQAAPVAGAAAPAAPVAAAPAAAPEGVQSHGF